MLSVVAGCGVSSAGRVINRENGLAWTGTKQWQVGPIARGLVLATLSALVRSTLDRVQVRAARHHHSARSDSCIDRVGDCCSLLAPELY